VKIIAQRGDEKERYRINRTEQADHPHPKKTVCNKEDCKTRNWWGGGGKGSNP